SNVWTGIRAAAAGGLAGIGKLLVNWSPLGLLYSAFAGVLRWFGVDLPAKFTDFGSQIIKGLVNGITGAIGSVRDTIVKVAGSAIGWFKETLGIHSPSRVFAELGGFTMAGLDQGLTDSQGGPLRAIRDMAKQLTAAGAGITLGTGVAMADPVQFDHRQPLTAPAVAQSQGQGATLAAAPAQAGDTYIINVYPGGDADLAKQIRRELEAIQREKAARGRSRLVDHD
ncbi:MAG: phage tail protein, partial [Gammaproteobacteria bacterium]|nr:phage tail protein [Gammaproteobacteria bacterium]